MCRVINGTRDDAILAAIRLNNQNGLRFNEDDWERIILLVAKHQEWKNWSNRKLAEELGCSAMTVQRHRSSGVTGVTPEKRRGKDGKSYPAKQTRRKPNEAKSKEKKQEEINVTKNAEPATEPRSAEESEPKITATTLSKLPFTTGLYCRPGEKPGATGEPYVSTSSLMDLPHDQPEVLVAQLIAHFPRDYVHKCPRLILDALRVNDGHETILPLLQAIIEEFSDDTILAEPVEKHGTGDVVESQFSKINEQPAERPIKIAPIWNGVKEQQLSPYKVHFEPDPDDDFFDWITEEEREELRKMQAERPDVRLVPLIRNYTIKSLPEHDPQYLISFLFSHFSPAYRKKFIYALLRRMLETETDRENAKNVITTLYHEFQSADQKLQIA